MLAYAEEVSQRFYGISESGAIHRSGLVEEYSQKSLLSNQQHDALMNLVAVDDTDEKQQLIAHNLRLVVNIAKRYSDHGVALLDLIREGNRGLIHAMESFEQEGGFRFATYAARCVRQSIECTIMNQMEPE